MNCHLLCITCVQHCSLPAFSSNCVLLYICALSHFLCICVLFCWSFDVWVGKARRLSLSLFLLCTLWMSLLWACVIPGTLSSFWSILLNVGLLYPFSPSFLSPHTPSYGRFWKELLLLIAKFMLNFSFVFITYNLFFSPNVQKKVGKIVYISDKHKSKPASVAFLFIRHSIVFS